MLVDMAVFLMNLMLYGFCSGINEFLTREYQNYRIYPVLVFIVYLLLMRHLVINTIPAEKYLKEYWS